MWSADGRWNLVSFQVADDGYGVSYIIAGEDTIFFHITAKVSSTKTVSNVSNPGNKFKDLITVKPLLSGRRWRMA